MACRRILGKEVSFDMLLAIDMGNSNIVLGCMEGEKILLEERISTNHSRTELEYAIDFKSMFELHGMEPGQITGAILSSVVPPLTDTICRAVEKITGIRPLVVGPGVKNGLQIRIDDPAQLGADLVVDAVAALAGYEPPLAVIDMGTATTISVIDGKGQYVGGMILPGMRTSLDSLVVKTSKLPKISLEAPKNFIGRNTVDCMKSGVVLGSAACLDGMLARIEEELGHPVTAVATGGLAATVLPYCKRKIISDPSLLLKGLRIIYEKNA